MASSEEMEIEFDLEDDDAMSGVADTAALACMTRTNENEDEDEDDTPQKNLAKLAVSSDDLLHLRSPTKSPTRAIILTICFHHTLEWMIAMNPIHSKHCELEKLQQERKKHRLE